MADVTEVQHLLHGVENAVCIDAGYPGVEKRLEHEGRPVIWQIAARRSTYKDPGKRSTLCETKCKIDKPQGADASGSGAFAPDGSGHRSIQRLVSRCNYFAPLKRQHQT